jgi:hypothetical protein
LARPAALSGSCVVDECNDAMPQRPRDANAVGWPRPDFSLTRLAMHRHRIVLHLRSTIDARCLIR